MVTSPRKLLVSIVSFIGFASGCGESPVDAGEIFSDSASTLEKAIDCAPPHDRDSILVMFTATATKKDRKEVANLVGGKLRDVDDDGVDDALSQINDGRLAQITRKKHDDDSDWASEAVDILTGHPAVDYAELDLITGT